MEITLNTDLLAFDATVKEYMSKFNGSMRDLMLRMMQLQVEALVRYTPPANKQAGTKTLSKDFNTLFAPLRGNVLERYHNIHPDMANFAPMGFTAAAQYHASQRNNRGRVPTQKPSFIKIKGARKPVDVTKQYLEGAVYRKLFNFRKGHIGKTKNGWLGGANKFGARVAQWIRNTGAAWGTASDTLTDKNGLIDGYLEVENNVKWVARYQRALESSVDAVRKADLDRGIKRHLDYLAKTVWNKQQAA